MPLNLFESPKAVVFWGLDANETVIAEIQTLPFFDKTMISRAKVPKQFQSSCQYENSACSVARCEVARQDITRLNTDYSIYDW